MKSLVAFHQRIRIALAILALWAIVPAASGDDAAERLRYYYPLPKAEPEQIVESDVCVYGGTVGGITAAIEAARMGRSAVLVEFGRHVGGMTASGLSKTDGGRTAGGIAAEFYAAVGKTGFTPAAAEAQFEAMLRQAGVHVFREHRLVAVEKDKNAITHITMENGNVFKAKVFIDATYEGDLLAMAKVSYTVGREPNSQYGESFNGVQFPNKGHQFRLHVDPYITPGDPASGFVPGITNPSPDAPGTSGEGDRRVQAYCFRMFIARFPDAIPFPKPKDYDTARYELVRRYIRAGAVKSSDFLQLDPGDSNTCGGFSTDDLGMGDGWPEGSYAQRERIYQEHVAHQQGLMYFLANDPGVPESIRSVVGAWGLAKGNFPETNGWPHQLYVREGRRMVGPYVMTEHNCRSEVIAEDSVGLGEYTMDSHNVQRFVVREGNEAYVQNEGDVQKGIPHPYPISYRAITPKPDQCSNLLVPVCVSATHIAYGSIRMEPVFMVLGQSAGTAAVMAIEAGVPVQQLDYARLRQRLLADKQNLDWKPVSASGEVH